MDMTKKINENMYILEHWHQSISQYSVLDITRVRKLIKEYIKEVDEAKKINIRDTIVLGTLEYIYQFLKNSIFIHLFCNWFNMEDVINATVEAWIKYLGQYQSSKYAINSKNFLDNTVFLNNILANLESKDILSFANGQIVNNLDNLDNLVMLFYLYLSEKQDNPFYNYDDFKIMVKDKVRKNKDLKKIYAIFNYLNKVIAIDFSSITIENLEKIKYLLYNFINMAALDNKKTYVEDDWIENILNKDMVQEILENCEISERKKSMLYKLYYLEKTKEEVAKESNIARQCVGCYLERTSKKVRRKYPELVRDKKY